MIENKIRCHISQSYVHYVLINLDDQEIQEIEKEIFSAKLLPFKLNTIFTFIKLPRRLAF